MRVNFTTLFMFLAGFHWLNSLWGLSTREHRDRHKNVRRIWPTKNTFCWFSNILILLLCFRIHQNPSTLAINRSSSLIFWFPSKFLFSEPNLCYLNHYICICRSCENIEFRNKTKIVSPRTHDSQANLDHYIYCNNSIPHALIKLISHIILTMLEACVLSKINKLLRCGKYCKLAVNIFFQI